MWTSHRRGEVTATQRLARREVLRRLAAGGVLAGLPVLAASVEKANMNSQVALYYGEELGRYGFPEGHPFGIDRQGAFYREAVRQGLDSKVLIRPGRRASQAEIERFHTPRFVEKVMSAEQVGLDYLDAGDTPSFPGVFDATSAVVGAALDGLDGVMSGQFKRSLQPIGGLHHARREAAAGFCVFNDLGVVIETLRSQHGIERVAYIDIDVHHGDGVYYPFETDPELIFADIHQDGRTLYPGTGRADETGKGKAAGTKLNIPLPPGSGDDEFKESWKQVEAHLRRFQPQFFVFQCGADGLGGDPLAQLRYTPAAHAHAARSLCQLADEFAGGRLMAFGGGGYDRGNLGRAWCAVLQELLRPNVG